MAKTQQEKLLIKFLKKKGNDKVEDGEKTQLEALADVVWKQALGYELYVDEEQEDGSVKRVFNRYYAPDKASIDRLFDHLIGKPKSIAPPKKGENKPKPVPMHRKVESALADHLNALAEDTNDRSKTDIKGSISDRLRILALSKDKPKGAKRPDTEHAVETEPADEG